MRRISATGLAGAVLLAGFASIQPPAGQTSTAALEQELARYRHIVSDWAGLTRYGSENSELPPPAPAEQRVVFLGDQITELWGQGNAKFFPGKSYLNRGITGQTTPQMLGRVIKPQTAAELNQMMQLVVQAGTGTTAQIPGVPVAGKTGTAELGLGSIYDAWFVCFAPANNPRFVVAVVVEKQPNGFGASVSAPIAKAIMESLLAGRSSP